MLIDKIGEPTGMELVIFTLLVLLFALGPLAYRFGADSHGYDERDRRTSWPGSRG